MAGFFLLIIKAALNIVPFIRIIELIHSIGVLVGRLYFVQIKQCLAVYNLLLKRNSCTQLLYGSLIRRFGSKVW